MSAGQVDRVRTMNCSKSSSSCSAGGAAGCSTGATGAIIDASMMLPGRGLETGVVTVDLGRSPFYHGARERVRVSNEERRVLVAIEQRTAMNRDRRFSSLLSESAIRYKPH